MPTRFVSLFLLFTLSWAQAPRRGATDETAPLIKMDVNLVQIDAVVTDAKGRHVPDLKVSDFEVLQDGKVQQLSAVHFVPAPAKPAGVVAEKGRKQELAQRVAAPGGRVRAQAIRRTVAVVVDDLALSFDNALMVRNHLEKFVQSEVQPGDMVAIFTTSSGVSALQRFTTDKRLLLAAAGQVRFSMRNRVGIDSSRRIYDERTGKEAAGLADQARATETSSAVKAVPDSSYNSMSKQVAGDASASFQSLDATRIMAQRFDNAQADLMGGATVAAMQQVVEGLRGLPGRKSLLLISANLAIHQKATDGTTMMERLRGLTDLANRAGVVIYTVDPRGVPFLGFTASDQVYDDPKNSAPERLLQMRQNRTDAYLDSRNGLGFVAEETGGRFLSGGDVVERLREASEDQLGYYLLSYRPDDGTFSSDLAKRKYHAIKVKVKGPGLKVRSRNGFFGLTDEAIARSRPQNRTDKVLSALLSPFRSDDIRLDVTSMFDVNQDDGTAVLSMIHIDAGALKFVQGEDGWRRAVIDVITTAYGADGQVSDVQTKNYRVKVKGEDYEQLLKRGFIYTVAHPVKRPGAFLFQVAVSDAFSDRIGAATQYVEVPDVAGKKAGFAISGILLMGKDATLVAAGEEPAPFSEAHPAIRRFQPGERLAYRYKILSPAGRAGTPDYESMVILYRDGKEVFRAEPRPVGGVTAEQKKLLVGGELQIPATYEAGEYTLQIVVHDRRAEEGRDLSSAAIDFRVGGAAAVAAR